MRGKLISLRVRKRQNPHLISDDSDFIESFYVFAYFINNFSLHFISHKIEIIEAIFTTPSTEKKNYLGIRSVKKIHKILHDQRIHQALPVVVF